MTGREAAEIIGVSAYHINTLCRKGFRKRNPGYYLRAKKLRVEPGDPGYNRTGFVWDIPAKEVRRFKKLKSPKGRRGDIRNPEGINSSD